MFFKFLSASAGLNIFLTVIEGLAVLGVCVFLFFRIRRERAFNSERKLAMGDSSLENFTKYLARAIETAGRRKKFFVFRIDYRDYDAVFKALGQVQTENLQKQQLEKLSRLTSWGAKAAVNKPGSYYLVLKNTENYDIDRFCRLILENISVKADTNAGFTVDVDINVAAGEFPECGASAEEIFKNLEIAMIAAMRKGENRYAVYSLQLSNTESDEYKFYEEIRQAIKSKEFTLYYQPIVDTANMEVFMGEALIRWSHKTRGVIPPSDFLYLMEQTGDIIWVGYWCFDQLVKQGAVWRSNYEQRFLLSFNLSVRQLMEPGLADEFRRIVNRGRVAADGYVFEIADMNVYGESEIARENIDKLHKYGFKLAVDGFGEKFSSLSLFEKIPVDIVKIEKKFWHEAGGASIKRNVMQALTDYSAGNNITPVALWVEAEDIEYLNALHITKMQGYAFSQPKSAKDFIGEVVLTPWSDELKRSAYKTAVQTNVIADIGAAEDPLRNEFSAPAGEAALEERPAAALREPDTAAAAPKSKAAAAKAKSPSPSSVNSESADGRPPRKNTQSKAAKTAASGGAKKEAKTSTAPPVSAKKQNGAKSGEGAQTKTSHETPTKGK